MEKGDSNLEYENETVDILEIWRVAKKHLRAIFTACAVVVLLTGVITYFFIPKKYRSYVKFYIQGKSSNELLSAVAAQGLGGLLPVGTLGGTTNADLCGEIVTAPSFLRNVLRSEGLPHQWKDAERFAKLVKVDKQASSGSLKISVIWTDPVTAYRLTKRIFIDYKKFVDKQINSNNSKARQFIESQYNLAKRRLDKAEEQLVQYQRAKGMIILPETATQAIEQYAKLEEQKVQNQIELNDAEQRLREAENLLNKKAPQIKENVFEAVNPLIMKYKETLTELEVNLAKARETLTDEHPTVKNLLRQIAELKQQIQAENELLDAPDIAADYLKALVEVAGLEAQQRSINAAYNEINERMAKLPDEMLTYGQLVREQKVAEQIYVLLSSQLEQAKISEAKEDNVILQVIQPATIPYKKDSPSTVLNMVVAGMLTLFAGVVWAFAMEKYKVL